MAESHSTSKACSKCKEVKPLADFHRAKKAASGRASACKVCELAMKRKRYEADPEKWKARHKRYYYKNKPKIAAGHRRDNLKKYGLTEETLRAKIASQGGRCPICLGALCEEGQRSKAPRVDHCHATGLVRDVLCFKCNIGLGSYDDRPEILRRAADYLERHRHASSTTSAV
jgi:hypothetical protein